MSRKVEVEIKVKVSIIADEDIEIGTVIDEMEYEFNDTTTKATIEDTEIIEYEVRDSR